MKVVGLWSGGKDSFYACHLARKSGHEIVALFNFDEFQDDLDQGPNRDSGYVYGPRLPRTVYLTANVAF
ncbi:hypothetical protein [Kiritimatiella glycovorans]|uniref:Diphthamide synthase domain-containing protein n=1 Tax=Kiritimatiella glycovorans TaxID=1307763 RepID=A0A0G3EK87_9BACT|nr:hypothetical protein [Kiritimatiella glycovorans]AKJ65230.1 hypothetical protein L21SP4_01996 [Kiritimatiella glycovorans]